ncbi:MAG: SUMF1/EgtB/PvdO family nonheme iron enzyme [Lentisphaerae bacterium]|nr:SUMF1/EgtB/PvdO family nonheme iron enzyme [Lentisphaerota bacterium]
MQVLLNRSRIAGRRQGGSLFVVSALLAGALTLTAQAIVGTSEDIHRAVRDNDVGYLKDLLVNADPELVNAVVGRGVTPLHVAAVLNHADVARELLAHGAKVDAVTDSGFTPLHWAASRDATACAAILIEAGANINAPSSKGITPLHWAASRNATNVVALLLDAGADTAAKTDTGAEPLHWAHLGDQEDAALLIADRMVSLEMESERTNVTFVADEELVPESQVDVAALPTEPSPLEKTDIFIAPMGTNESRALIVNIGLGQTMVFEWIRPLKLWAGKYEVSNGQFRRFRPSHDSRFRENYTLNGSEQPVVFVSWQDAQDFCEWLNRTYQDRLPKGFRFRLPYSVEWTVLARCGENRKYPWGNRWPPAYGNFADLTAREHLAEWNGITHYDDGSVVTCPVSQSGMNEWGLYGIAGNVWEWCDDWYDRGHRYRVRRGGSWDFDGEPNLRISAIGFDRPAVKDDTIGFRVVATMEK